ncbi:MAG: hypothetical protein OJJ54_23215 [Pseudonocardia sp.]|nr:hypothetical protein [Pseudonocardia sp.]
MNSARVAHGDSETAVVETAVVAGAVTRLTAEFAGERTLSTVRGAVQSSRRDLSGVPAGALPELLERLARQRLLAGR